MEGVEDDGVGNILLVFICLSSPSLSSLLKLKNTLLNIHLIGILRYASF